MLHPVPQFACRIDLRMTGNDLFEQRRSRTDHADDENGSGKRNSQLPEFGKTLSGKQLLCIRDFTIDCSDQVMLVCELQAKESVVSSMISRKRRLKVLLPFSGLAEGVVGKSLRRR